VGSLQEFNPNHEPAGSPIGGQFARKKGNNAGTEANAQAQGTQGGGRSAVSTSTAKGQGRPAPNEVVAAEATRYARAHGLPPVVHGYVEVDQRRAQTIAALYDELPVNDSANPEVREAYAALASELREQWDYATSNGMRFEPWTKDGQPYQNSTEMAADVRNNRHLYFYTGGDPHPLLNQVDPKTGLTMNDMFRAVHDYYGHSAGGYGFGERGEENAWLAHSQMFSMTARAAMTTETRGQNSYVNFGRHNYDAQGNFLNIPRDKRPYAMQKVALLPSRFWS
jgi:hypothetical protein